MANWLESFQVEDTPHKKVKPNEDCLPSFSTQHSLPKESLLSKLRAGTLQNRRKAANEVSEFTLPLEHRTSAESQGMVNEDEEEGEGEGEGEEAMTVRIPLGRKFTCVLEQEEELPLAMGLCKCEVK
jgi:hypothetical protein